MMSSAVPKTVMVTGGGGNVGGKAVEALAADPRCEKVFVTVHGDHEPEFSEAARAKVTVVRADLTRPGGDWDAAMAQVDAVMHFAAANPVPKATWAQAIASSDMTFNVALAARRAQVSRFVFCSSNHVMGGYKDAPLAETIAPGGLTTDLVPAPGTKWDDGERRIDSTPYASAKVMGEQLMQALAGETGSTMSCVSIRVGWTLPGDNEVSQLSLSGSPNEQGSQDLDDPEAQRNLKWFRDMWLSNDDLARLVVASVYADAADWPTPAIVVNGNSNNRAMPWSMREAAQWLGVTPQDDFYALWDAAMASQAAN